MYFVNTLAGGINQLLGVADDTADFDLESAQFTGGSCMFVRRRRVATDHMPRGRTDRWPTGIIYVFIACQSAVDRLAGERHKLVLFVAVHATVLKLVLGHSGQPEHRVEFAVSA